MVPARFFRARDVEGRWRALLDRHVAAAAQHTRPLSAERPAVLMSTGAWGVGTRLMETARQLADHGCVPVLLCGNDARLRHRATRHPGLLPLGWVTDLPGLMAATHVLLDNAAGQTAAQALAAGLPVVGHRPLPGHAEAGVRAMAQAGLSRYAAGAAEPAHSAHELAFPGPARARLTAAARAALRGDPVDELLELAGRVDTADSRTA